MRSEFVWIAMGVALVFASGSPARADAPGGESVSMHQYVGALKCKTCHKKDLIGNQFGEWEDGVHAKAFDTLKSDDAAKIAKEKGLSVPAHEAPECLKCHVTAYGLPAEAFAKAPLKHSDGVQCESCHGPGNDYKKKKTMADHDKSVAAGMWDPGNDETVCTACHNDESPTFDGFEYAKRKEDIAHPIPEDVKGKYIEVEKKLKAEKRAAGGAADDEEEE